MSSSSPGGGASRPPIWVVVLGLLVLMARLTEAAQNLRHVLADSDSDPITKTKIKTTTTTTTTTNDIVNTEAAASKLVQDDAVEDTAEPISTPIAKSAAAKDATEKNLRRLAESSNNDQYADDEVEPDFMYWVTPIASLGLTCGGSSIKSRDGEYTCIKAGEALCQDNDGGPFGRWTFGITEDNQVNLWTPKNDIAWTFCTEVSHVCIGEERDPRPDKYSNQRPYLYFYDEKTQRTVGNLTCDGTDGYNGENLNKPTILKMVDNSDVGMYTNYNITVLKFKKGQTPDPGDSNQLLNITVARVGEDMAGSLSFNEDKCTWTDLCPRRTFSTQLPPTDDSDFIVMETDRGEFVFENLRAVNGTGVSEDINYWYGEDFGGNSLSYVRDADGSITGRITTIEYGEIIFFDTDANGVETSNTVASSDYHGSEVLPLFSKGNRKLSETTPPLFPASRNNPAVVNLMVVYSIAAEKSVGEKKIKRKIIQAIEETNEALDKSGVYGKVNLVHQYRHPTYQGVNTENNNGCKFLEDGSSPKAGKIKGNAHFCHLENELYDPADGKLDDVPKNRIKYGADAVAFIFERPRLFPLSTIKNLWPAKAAFRQAPRDGMFVMLSDDSVLHLGHELGHLWGCQHDRGTLNECDTTDHNDTSYAFRNPSGEFGTQMSYDCKEKGVDTCDISEHSGKCTRIIRYSNTRYYYAGLPLGNKYNDCASQINSFIATTADYACVGGLTGDTIKMILRTKNIPNANSDDVPKITLYSTTGLTHVVNIPSSLPDKGEEKSYDIPFANDFGCFDYMILEARSMDGWLPESIILEKTSHFKATMNLNAEPSSGGLYGLLGIWIDGRPFDTSSGYQGYEHYSQWLVQEDKPPSKCISTSDSLTINLKIGTSILPDASSNMVPDFTFETNLGVQTIPLPASLPPIGSDRDYTFNFNAGTKCIEPTVQISATNSDEWLIEEGGVTVEGIYFGPSTSTWLRRSSSSGLISYPTLRFSELSPPRRTVELHLKTGSWDPFSESNMRPELTITSETGKTHTTTLPRALPESGAEELYEIEVPDEFGTAEINPQLTITAAGNSLIDGWLVLKVKLDGNELNTNAACLTAECDRDIGRFWLDGRPFGPDYAGGYDFNDVWVLTDTLEPMKPATPAATPAPTPFTPPGTCKLNDGQFGECLPISECFKEINGMIFPSISVPWQVDDVTPNCRSEPCGTQCCVPDLSPSTYPSSCSSNGKDGTCSTEADCPSGYEWVPRVEGDPSSFCQGYSEKCDDYGCCLEYGRRSCGSDSDCGGDFPLCRHGRCFSSCNSSDPASTECLDRHGPEFEICYENLCFGCSDPNFSCG